MLLGGAAVVGLLVYSKVKAVGNLTFLPGPINGMNFIDYSPTIDLTVLVQNTSSQSFMISSFTGQVYANNTLVGFVYNFLPVQIPGNSQVPIPATIKFQLLGMVNDIVKAFQYKNFRQTININGFINADYLQIPVNLNFTIGA